MKTKISYVNVLCIVLLLVITGCVSPVALNNVDTSNNTEIGISLRYPDWYDLSEGLDIREYELEDDIALVVRIDPSKYMFEIQQDIVIPKKVSEWQNVTSADIVVNGGYFQENYTSSGGLIVNGELSGVLTHSGKNGYTGMMVMNEGDIDLLYLPDEEYQESENVTHGLQSFPTLIIPDYQEGIESDSGKRARRSVIAEDGEGNILLIQTKGVTQSLYTFMKFLLNSDLDVVHAINLDGGPSSGLIVRIDGHEIGDDSLVAVPNVLTVGKK